MLDGKRANFAHSLSPPKNENEKHHPNKINHHKRTHW